MPLAPRRTSTSPGPGAASSSSSTTSGAPVVSSTAARMRIIRPGAPLALGSVTGLRAAHRGRHGGRLRVGQPPQLLEGDVAAHQVPVLGFDERRLLFLADRAQLAMAARVEDAAARRLRRGRDLARELDPLAAAAVDRRHRGQQRLRVGVVRACEHDLGGTELHQPAQVHDRDAVGDVAHDAEVVRDEQVGDPFLHLQLDEQVEDRGLHGHVERRGRLVADDEARIAGERAGDRDALLEAPGELVGTDVQVAL